MSNSGAAGGRAVGCSSSVSDAWDGSWRQVESPRPSTGAQTRLCHAHTQLLVTSPVLSTSCPKTGLWRTGGSQDLKRSQARSQCWVGVRTSLHPCLLTLESGWSFSLFFSLLEIHLFFLSTVHRLREFSFQGQLSMCSTVLPQPSAAFCPHGTPCSPTDRVKQCDEHLSHEHLSLLPSFPQGKIEWE